MVRCIRKISSDTGGVILERSEGSGRKREVRRFFAALRMTGGGVGAAVKASSDTIGVILERSEGSGRRKCKVQSAKSIFNFPFSIFNFFPGVILSGAKDQDEARRNLTLQKSKKESRCFFIGIFAAMTHPSHSRLHSPRTLGSANSLLVAERALSLCWGDYLTKKRFSSVFSW